MANLKSSKKDIRRTARRTALNKPFRRNAEMYPKKVEKALAAGNVEEAKGMISAAYKALDKAARRKVIRKKTADRSKSRLMKAVARVEAASK